MSDAEIIRYYRARAAEYEQIYYRDNQQRQGELKNEADALRVLASDKTVVELACGTGYWSRIMAETAKYVLATDISPEMIATARNKTSAANLTYRVLDMFDPSLAEQQYDLVAVGFWFSHQPRQDYDRLYQLLKSLLAPGGRIWMIDNNPPAEGPLNLSVRTDEHGNNFKRRYLDNGSEYVILKNYFSESELREELSGQFRIDSLSYGQYYWSSTLSGL